MNDKKDQESLNRFKYNTYRILLTLATLIGFAILGILWCATYLF